MLPTDLEIRQLDVRGIMGWLEDMQNRGAEDYNVVGELLLSSAPDLKLNVSFDDLVRTTNLTPADLLLLDQDDLIALARQVVGKNPLFFPFKSRTARAAEE